LYKVIILAGKYRYLLSASLYERRAFIRPPTSAVE